MGDESINNLVNYYVNEATEFYNKNKKIKNILREKVIDYFKTLNESELNEIYNQIDENDFLNENFEQINNDSKDEITKKTTYYFINEIIKSKNIEDDLNKVITSFNKNKNEKNIFGSVINDLDNMMQKAIFKHFVFNVLSDDKDLSNKEIEFNSFIKNLKKDISKKGLKNEFDILKHLRGDN